MRIGLTKVFQDDIGGLDEGGRAAVFEAILALPRALKTPHVHPGLGLRKVHSSGIWEVRVGLGLRLLFATDAEGLTLVRAGTHEVVRRYLRSL
jgi:hypothetical protein